LLSECERPGKFSFWSILETVFSVFSSNFEIFPQAAWRNMRSRYMSMREVGRGGNGQVLRGSELVLHKPVEALLRENANVFPVMELQAHDDTPAFANAALKLSLIGAEETAHESRILRQIGEHPNIVKLTDVVTRGVWSTDEGSLVYQELSFLVLELAQGSLYHLREQQKLSRSHLWTLAVDLLSGTAHIHSMDFVHLDLTPVNVLLSASNHWVIADYGTTASTGSLQEAMQCGTPYFSRGPKTLRYLADFDAGCDEIHDTMMIALEAIADQTSTMRTRQTEQTPFAAAADVLKSRYNTSVKYLSALRVQAKLRVERSFDMWAAAVTLYFASTGQGLLGPAPCISADKWADHPVQHEYEQLQAFERNKRGVLSNVKDPTLRHLLQALTESNPPSAADLVVRLTKQRAQSDFRPHKRARSAAF
jgi:serine/threonine protein kinase